MKIRMEGPSDMEAIRRANLAAFETSAEADLVDALRQAARPFLSLVAEEDGEILGHILFTPMTLAGGAACGVAGLAPMAVLPERQSGGIGGLLVKTGLDACRGSGYAAVAVLGHPDYYPRFGFVPASRFGLRSEYEVPDEVFMALELVPGALDDLAGTLRYHEAFAAI